MEKRAGDKVYVNEKKGLINEVGRRLAPGAVMVPARVSEQPIGILEKHGVRYTTAKVWQ